MKNVYRYKLTVTRQTNGGLCETNTKSKNLLTLNRIYKRLLREEKDSIIQMVIYDYFCMKYVKFYEVPYFVDKAGTR